MTPFMFGKKPTMKEGVHVFCSKLNGEFKDIIFGVVTGVDGNKIGINGLIINPVGAKNKLDQGKAGQRTFEILTNPTPENCIFSLIYRVEQNDFADVVDLESNRVEIISPRAYEILDEWVRESLPELINNVLSLPSGDERDRARRALQNKRDSLQNKHLKRNLYAICRSLKIVASPNKNW